MFSRTSPLETIVAHFRRSIHFANQIKMKHIATESSSELDKLIKENEGKNVIVLFTGSKNSTGKSWCPDCVVADPVIEDVARTVNDPDGVFITVSVGDLPTWKSPTNAFRKHSIWAVNCVPTLINVSKKSRLEEGGCADKELVKKLFEGSLGDSVTSKTGTCEGGVCRIR